MTPTKVLLVDDEASFVEKLAKRLSKSDVTVVTAADSHEAGEKLGRHRTIDAVVLDVKTMGADFLEFLKHVKSSDPLVEVIILTDHAKVGAAIEGMKHGALDYLVKPCDMEELSAKIQEAKLLKSRQEAKIAEALAVQIAFHRSDQSTK